MHIERRQEPLLTATQIAALEDAKAKIIAVFQNCWPGMINLEELLIEVDAAHDAQRPDWGNHIVLLADRMLRIRSNYAAIMLLYYLECAQHAINSRRVPYFLARLEAAKLYELMDICTIRSLDGITEPLQVIEHAAHQLRAF